MYDRLPTYLGQAPSMGPQLLMIVFLFLGMWFLIIAPQRKKQKKQKMMIEALGSGDKVVTIGGFYGIVQSVKEDRVVLKRYPVFGTPEGLSYNRNRYIYGK